MSVWNEKPNQWLKRESGVVVVDEFRGQGGLGISACLFGPGTRSSSKLIMTPAASRNDVVKLLGPMMMTI